MPARALRYFTRATSSRATPSYANATARRSRPGGVASAGAGRNVVMHVAQIGSAAAPHPGHDPGSSVSVRARNMPANLPTPWDTNRPSNPFGVTWTPQRGCKSRRNENDR